MARILTSFVLILLLTFIFMCEEPEHGGNNDDNGTDASDIGTDASTEPVWIDPISSLMWQVEPTDGTMIWSHAKTHCESLELGGFSDWRLPTISELRSLIRGCDSVLSGPCEVTDSCLSYLSCWSGCEPCNRDRGPDGGCYWPSEMSGICNFYWSSSAVAETNIENDAWGVSFGEGYVVYNFQGNSFDVRCVR